MFIDGIEVPDGPFGPATNIKFVNGQWVLVPALGKDLSPEYRVIPEKLLRDAALFQDPSGAKVGYIDNNALINYLKSVTPPRTPLATQIKQGINTTINSIQKAASDITNFDPEVARLSEKFRGEYLAPGKTGPKSGGFLPLNLDGNAKPSAINPVASTKPDTTLAGTALPVQGPGLGGRDVISNPWSNLAGLDFSEPGVVFDANDNPMLILLDPKNGNKALAVSQASFASQITSMPKQQIAQYQAALKKAGQWSGTVDGELNYLNRGQFTNALLAAAQGATQENLAAYTSKTNKVKGLFDVINEAARAAGAGTTTTRETYIVNRETAQQALDDIYLQSIGRKANKKEVDEFYQKVQKEAKARPSVRTDTGTDATTRQGFTGETIVGMAEAQAEARPEFLAYQLSTNFYNALLGASRLPMEFGAGEAPTTGPLG
jgi:hypothetical protein